MTAPLPFPVAAQCGYCDRHLVTCENGYECPRCAPLLRSLPLVGYADTIRKWRQFQRDARRSGAVS